MSQYMEGDEPKAMELIDFSKEFLVGIIDHKNEHIAELVARLVGVNAALIAAYNSGAIAAHEDTVEGCFSGIEDEYAQDWIDDAVRDGEILDYSDTGKRKAK